MKLLEREIGSIEFAANQTRTIQLPRNYAYRALNLLLICDLTRTATAADGGAPKDCAPAQLVKNIMIRANGRDVIKNIDMETLHRTNEMNWGCRPYIYAHDWLGYADAADKVMKVAARIDFAMWRAIRPIDSLLDSAGLATLELIVTWGSGIDTMDDTWPGTGSAPSVTVNAAQLYVATEEYVGVPAGTPFMVNKEYMIRQQVISDNNQFQIQLPTGNLYRQLVLKTHTDGDQTDLIMPFDLTDQQTITLKSGTEVFKYRIASALQSQNRLVRQMQVPERIGSAAALNHALQELLQEGYYLLDFCPDGHLTECLDTTRLSSLELVLDVDLVGTADYVDIYPTELIAPPAQQVAKV